MEDLLLLVRVLLSLAAVFGGLWWLRRRVSDKAARTSTILNLITRRNVGQKAAVAVVDFDGRRFLLGVTDNAVNVLAHTVQPADEVKDFGQSLEKATDTLGVRMNAQGGPMSGSIFDREAWAGVGAAFMGGKK